MKEDLHILIVDDDEVDRMAIRRHLTSAKLATQVAEATSASSAHKHIAENNYNCIFLDYRLPDADGISLVEQLREEGFSAPIIVLTGQGDEQIAVDLMKAGASDYLAKARLSPANLTRLLRNALKVYHAEQMTQAAQAQLRQTNALLKLQNQELEDQRRQIEQRNRQLLEANRLKSEFLAIISHELRTPLNAILGFSQILKSQTKGKLNEYQLEMVNRVFSNGESLLNLVNEILDMSVIESQRTTLVPEYFDIEQLIRFTIAEFQPLAERKGLEIQFNSTLQNPEIYNDNQRLKQVFVNLLSNAIKFTKAGYIQICLNSTVPDCIEIQVKDTGIGIPPDQLDNIFQLFRQVDQSSQRHYSGTGLGLTITHALISMMDGFITTESHVGEGSTFEVRIPRKILTAPGQVCQKPPVLSEAEEDSNFHQISPI